MNKGAKDEWVVAFILSLLIAHLILIDQISVVPCILVNENNLISGKTLSCGCISKENGKKRIRDLTGKRFGNLEVIDQAPNKNGRVAWNCICDDVW